MKQCSTCVEQSRRQTLNLKIKWEYGLHLYIDDDHTKILWLFFVWIGALPFLPLPPPVGQVDPNRFKHVLLCFIIIIWIMKSLSIPQQTISLVLNMVINHEITFDFSWFFFFCNPIFLGTQTSHGSNGPFYTVKRRSFFACYRVQRTQQWLTRVLKKRVAFPPLVGLMDPYTQYSEQLLCMLSGPQRIQRVR